MTSARSLDSMIKFGIDLCGVCSQTLIAIPVIPGALATSLNVTVFGIGEERSVARTPWHEAHVFSANAMPRPGSPAACAHADVEKIELRHAADSIFVSITFSAHKLSQRLRIVGPLSADQNRHRAVRHHAVGLAAEQQAREPATPVRCHHEEIAALRFRRCDNAFCSELFFHMQRLAADTGRAGAL